VRRRCRPLPCAQSPCSPLFLPRHIASAPEPKRI
jgi:hypothetical protein